MKCPRCKAGMIAPVGYYDNEVVWQCTLCNTQYNPEPPITRKEFLAQEEPFYLLPEVQE